MNGLYVERTTDNSDITNIKNIAIHATTCIHVDLNEVVDDSCDECELEIKLRNMGVVSRQATTSNGHPLFMLYRNSSSVNLPDAPNITER